jgi:CubicO group peptidase (beta-lactamase class C family)
MPWWIAFLLLLAGGPENLAPLLEPIRKEHDIPALTAALVRDGKVLGAGAVGVRRNGSAEPVTLDDRWHIGSCTKAMTATLIGVLVDQGKLKWSTTIGEVIDQKIHPAWKDVTVEQLLSHRSGLPEDRVPDPNVFLKLRALKGPMQEQRKKLIEIVLEQEPAAEPGTKMQYSNYGYTVAGAMAEAVTGKSWEELLEEHLFEPLGMTSAGFGPPTAENPWGHRGALALEPGPFADNPAVIGPAGTVHCTLSDWAKFAALHVAGARGENDFLKQETFKKLHTPPEGEDYALGWVVARRSWADGTVLHHAGSNGFWFAVVWIAPKKNLAVLAATNTASPRACDVAVSALLDHFSAEQALDPGDDED